MIVSRETLMKRRENGKNKLKTGIIIIIIVNLIIIGKTGYYFVEVR